MTSGRTAHTGLCVFALALLFAACGDGGSEAPAPPAVPLPSSMSWTPPRNERVLCDVRRTTICRR